MDRFDCLETFVNVHETGSFSAAAKRQNTTQPTISKRIAWLEKQFGTTLFRRSTRRLAPTEEAARIYEHARNILETYNLARASVLNALPEPGGTLVVAVPSSLARHVLAPIAAAFLRSHTGITLDFRMSEGHIDLVKEGAELALRIGELKDSSLHMRTLGRISRMVVASPEYLKQCSPPRDPDELKEHSCIGYSRFGSTTNWIFESEFGRHTVDVDCSFRVDDADMLQAAVLEGMGIALLPSWLALPHLASGAMEKILPEYMVPGLPLNAVYPDSGILSHRARCFLDYITHKQSQLVGLQG